ncbi:Glucan endo-1,3-beta-glucosidase A1 [Micractinium conductrix]|uniref:Glucan endo-1,3-beta-glucosidase A1 n=1 Tax=Micractinium conductrix TaxID=554055 RepID=A0A2P6VMK0_9CHLO|nr:Glucan endo-1,3-beta-glucosidase A1 [Micractinium conductrix]|eukprot:PSC75318.1 Glucan endo-1,3-beta-glucosidase A1 [Micractinium conductrix]
MPALRPGSGTLSPPPPRPSPPPPSPSPPPPRPLPPPPAPAPASVDWGTPILTATFEGSTLDRTLFDVEQDCWGGGNGEHQCYVDRPENLRVENGRLVIEARRGDWAGTVETCTRPWDAWSCTAAKPFTSARIRTKASTRGSWTYGRFEVRAQLAKGDFLWPAIWMLPTDNVYGTWAASGEIDIVEFRGQPALNDTLEGTLHYGAAWPANAWRGSGHLRPLPGTDLSAAMHDYALEWSADGAGRPLRMRWLVDGVQFHEQALNTSWSAGAASPYTQDGQPWDRRFHLVLNLAVGGGFFPTSQYGVWNTHAQWDATSAGWARPRMEVEHVKVWAWPRQQG